MEIKVNAQVLTQNKPIQIHMSSPEGPENITAEEDYWFLESYPIPRCRT